MEIEIHWEVSPVLNKSELIILSETVNNLAQNTDHFNLILKEQLSEPLYLNLIIINDQEMKLINSTYRHKNKTTDVLTFPFDQMLIESNDFVNQELDPSFSEIQSNYAEIYISQDTAIRQCKDQNLTLLNEFITLFVHGLLHAFHYDHETSEESKNEMKELEKKMLTYIGVNVAPLTT